MREIIANLITILVVGWVLKKIANEPLEKELRKRKNARKESLKDNYYIIQYPRFLKKIMIIGRLLKKSRKIVVNKYNSLFL